MKNVDDSKAERGEVQMSLERVCAHAVTPENN